MMNEQQLVGTVTRRHGMTDTLNRSIRLWVVFALLVTAFVVLPSPSAFGVQTTGTVTGTVERNGRPLAGVEVFLGISPGPANSEFENRYACTNANGEFEFAGVPFDQGLISATGPEVQPAVPCSNRKFVTRRGFPLVPQFYNGNNTRVFDTFTLSETSPTAALDYNIIRLPTRNRYLVFTARAALASFYDFGSVPAAEFFLDLYSARLQRMIDAGRVSGEQADILVGYAEVLRLDFGL